ncbi:hypothetical protein GJ744_009440 [Endocarpon pusillum]|uniref:HpcH/HpaI aldolase/citrate lyase domain-containing protein n=1 Tax=Endocarpon pusillum TaxID=364733 RepID=A0A8H7ANH7_9EURO|nr:hypothetical protein GJ744_009440 [Endocarpon pusillum]
MQNANRLRKALLSHSGISFGAWQMLPGGNLSRTIARTGYDWVCVDCEHGNIADNQMHESVAAIASCGVSPVVRIPANEAWMVKRALDSGAHGIVVPLLYTADNARNLVQSAKFPPVGQRGYGSPFSMGAFGRPSASEYLQQANEALVTIVQIETREAFENVESIARVEGIDVLLVGPYDLGNNLHHPITSGDGEPDVELKAAIEKIRKAAVAAGKKAGIYCISGEQARRYADQGFHMVRLLHSLTCLVHRLIGLRYLSLPIWSRYPHSWQILS